MAGQRYIRFFSPRHSPSQPNLFTDHQDPYELPPVQTPSPHQGNLPQEWQLAPGLGIQFPRHPGSPLSSPVSLKRRNRNGESQNLPISPFLPSEGSPSLPSLLSAQSHQSINTLGTPNTIGSSRSRYSDPEIQTLIDRRATAIAPWGIHWYMPFCMVGLFISGVIGAVAHHIFYLSLDGKEAKNQLQMIRYGNALAYWTKATLVGSVVIAYRQRIWYTLRRTALSLGAIDALFGVVEDPTFFRRWEMVAGARLATLMAAATWLIPIASVLSPATLLTRPATFWSNNETCLAGSLNFTAEGFNDWLVIDNPRLGGLPGWSMNYYNTTDKEHKKPGWFDYYDMPSKNLIRLTTLSAYSNGIRRRDNASDWFCGARSNCTYTISFIGPGYRCDELASGVGTGLQGLQKYGAPFNTTALLPEGKFTYYAQVDIGDYQRPQPGLKFGADSDIDYHQTWPVDLGIFKSEPVLWIGYTVNTTETISPGSMSAQRWNHTLIPKIIRCEHFETNYTVQFNHTTNVQMVNVTDANFIAPIIGTSIPPKLHRSKDRTDPFPASGWVRPTDSIVRYKIVGAYHSLGLQLRRWLNGSLIISNPKYPQNIVTTTELINTRLFNASNKYPINYLATGIQSLYEDLLLSLISDPMAVVAANVTVPCTKSRFVTVFHYRRRDLWIGYTIVIFVALVFLSIGAMAMHANGVVSDTMFSRVMVTTRNPTIDKLSVGACLGGEPFPEDLARTKLRFGVLLEDEVDIQWPRSESAGGRAYRVAHCAFGTEAETEMIVKRKQYAGLGREKRAWNERAAGRWKEKMD